MPISYGDLVLVAENEGALTLAAVKNVVDRIIRDNLGYDNYEDYEYSDSPRYQLREISKMFCCDSVKFYGSPDEYHNLAVSFAKAEMSEYACNVVNRGLQMNPFSVDLLADAIRYGIDCNREETCAAHVETLESIPYALWNWRAFSFSIDYYLDRLNRVCTKNDINRVKNKAISLANRFIQNIGNDQAYYDKSVVMQTFKVGDLNSQKAVLKQGMDTLLNAAPKCGLRYADLLFDEGDYSGAAEALDTCCLNVFKPQPDINSSYSYLLRALSMASNLFIKNKSDFSQEEDTILLIYRDIHTSLESGLNGVYKDTAVTVVRVINAQTSVDYPYSDVVPTSDF